MEKTTQHLYDFPKLWMIYLLGILVLLLELKSIL